MSEFNKELFAELLLKAKGKRSLNKYAEDSGVTSAHISRLTRSLLDTAPTPQTIEKLANAAVDVTYEELMIAAGHFKFKDTASNFATSLGRSINDLKRKPTLTLKEEERLNSLIKLYEIEENAGRVGENQGEYTYNSSKQSNHYRLSEELKISPEDLKILEEIKKHPMLFHDLATNPEKKIKELIKLKKMQKLLLDEDDEEYGEGFGDIED